MAAAGYHPEGIRIGEDSSGNRTAVKAWDQRSYKDYDDTVEIGTRNIKVALRRLRRFARQGADMELDLDDTIRQTARNAGYLDIRMVPERHNAVKVLMLLDVGGTMDGHIARIEELFSAAHSEFKHLEVYYFHNCLYDFVWRDNRRRHAERIPTWDVLRTYNADWRVIFVGDATMSPYEILHRAARSNSTIPKQAPCGCSGWRPAFPKSIWLNPEPESLWPYRQSIDIIRKLMQNRMFGVTLGGLEQAMRLLSK